MSLSLLRWIAREISSWPMKFGVEYPIIRLTGGEPFLFPFLEDVLELFNFAPKIEISTNGTIVTERQLNRISIRKVALNLSVYMDDSNQEIVSISKLQSVLNSDVPTVCVIVAHSQNLASLPLVFDQLEHIGAQVIIIVGVKPRRDDFETVMHQFLLHHKEIRYLRRLIERRKHSGITYIFKEPSSCKKHNLLNTDVPGCLCATSQLSILTDGSVVPCNSLLNIVVGNCIETPLIHLYNSPEMQFVRSMSKLHINDLNPCVSCKDKMICCAGSRIDAYQRTGDWLSVDMHAPCAGRLSHLAFVDPSLTALHNNLQLLERVTL